MKKILLLFLSVLSVGIHGVECRPNSNKFVKPTERGEAYLLQNKLTNYVINFRYVNATPSSVPKLLTGMPAPVNKTGFSRFDFTSLILNGIDSRDLEPQKYQIFKDGKTAGLDVYYNFDGIPMIQRFYVSDETPVLTMQWKRGKGKAMRPISSLAIRFGVQPNMTGAKRNSYRREIVTPAKVYAAITRVRWKAVPLKPTDTALILQDAKYQVGKTPKAAAPVLLVPCWKNILSGTAVFGAQQDIALNFRLAPNASNWSFGLLDSEKKRSNAEFAEFVKNDLKLFK